MCRGLVAPWHVGSSQTRAWTRVPCLGRRILNHCATREALCSSLYGDFSNHPLLCLSLPGEMTICIVPSMHTLYFQRPCGNAKVHGWMDGWNTWQAFICTSLCPQGCKLWWRRQTCKLFHALMCYRVLNWKHNFLHHHPTPPPTPRDQDPLEGTDLVLGITASPAPTTVPGQGRSSILFWRNEWIIESMHKWVNK